MFLHVNLDFLWTFYAKTGHPKIVHLLDANVWLTVGEHLVHFFRDTFRGDFVLESITDTRVFGGSEDLVSDFEIEATGKTDSSEDAERVV